MPARSPGANPVRQARASSGEVSQLTVVIPIGPRNWASISPMSRYSSRHRPSSPPPDSLAERAMRVSGTTMVMNCSVRTEAWVSPWARSPLTFSAIGGLLGRRWLLTHSSRSAPSSGTVRTMKISSSTFSVRPATSIRPVSASP